MSGITATSATRVSDLPRAHTGALWITASTVLTSAANYAFSLALIHVLAPADYVAYAAVQSLLLILGSGCMAAIPWAIAAHVAADPTPGAARQALSFGLGAATVQGLGFAAAAYLIVAPSSGHTLAASTAAAAFALSIITAPLGLLQGRQQMSRMAALRVIETVVRLGVAAGLLLTVAADANLAVAGFTVGSLTLFAMSLHAVRDALPLTRAPSQAVRALLGRSTRLGLVQIAVASLGVIDTIVVTYTALGTTDRAAYQIAALLGRVPLYLGTALALAYFPALAQARTEAEIRTGLSSAVRLLTILGLPGAALLATVPAPVLTLLAANRADLVASVLPATSTCGIAVAASTVILTGLQARGRYRTALIALGPIVLVQPLALLFFGNTGDLHRYALAAAALAVTSVAVASFASRTWRPWGALGRRDLLTVATPVALAAAAGLLPALWPVAALAALGGAVLALRHPDRTASSL